MYSLRSGDMTNLKEQEMIRSEDFLEKVEYVKKKITQDNLMYIIFGSSEIKQSVTIALTLGDELSIPMEKSVADILFFCCCAKKNGKSIRNITQAYALYKLYENDYSKIDELEEDEKLRWTLLNGQHSYLLPGYSIKWYIPVSFFSKNGERFVTLSGSSYAKMEVNGETFKIPRRLFLNFFKDSMVHGRIIGPDTEYIRSCFDLGDREALMHALNFIGYHDHAGLREIPIPRIIYAQDDKIFCSKNPHSIYWKSLSDHLYVLLPHCNYVPLCPRDDDEYFRLYVMQ